MADKQYTKKQLREIKSRLELFIEKVQEFSEDLKKSLENQIELNPNPDFFSIHDILNVELVDKLHRIALSIPKEFRSETVSVQILDRLTQTVKNHNWSPIENWELFISNQLNDPNRKIISNVGLGLSIRSANKQIGAIEADLITAQSGFTIWINQIWNWIKSHPLRSALATLSIVSTGLVISWIGHILGDKLMSFAISGDDLAWTVMVIFCSVLFFAFFGIVFVNKFTNKRKILYQSVVLTVSSFVILGLGLLSTDKAVGLLTAVLVVMTALLIWFGLIPFIREDENRNKILSLEARPYISLEWEQNFNDKVIWLTIKNHGKLPAYNISVKAPDLVRPYEDKMKKELSLRNISWFTSGIKSLAPGQSMRTLYFAIGDDWPDNLEDFESSVSISYIDPNGDTLFTPEYILALKDVGDGWHLGTPNNAATRARDSNAESLKIIAVAVGKLSDNTGIIGNFFRKRKFRRQRNEASKGSAIFKKRVGKIRKKRRLKKFKEIAIQKELNRWSHSKRSDGNGGTIPMVTRDDVISLLKRKGEI